MENVSIIGIGIATMDIYCYKNKMYPGGNEYNIAYNAKKQGAKAAFMGVLANDKVGEILEETLQKEQIDTSHSHHEEGSSGYALVDLKDGDRVFIDWNKKGVTDLHPFEFTKEEIEYIKEFDIACISWGARVNHEKINVPFDVELQEMILKQTQLLKKAEEQIEELKNKIEDGYKSIEINENTIKKRIANVENVIIEEYDNNKYI